MQAYGKAQLQNKIFIGANFCVPPLFCRKNGWLCVRSNERHADGALCVTARLKPSKSCALTSGRSVAECAPSGENMGRLLVLAKRLHVSLCAPNEPSSRTFVQRCTKGRCAHGKRPTFLHRVFCLKLHITGQNQLTAGGVCAKICT